MSYIVNYCAFMGMAEIPLNKGFEYAGKPYCKGLGD